METQLYTYQDAVEQVLDVFDLTRTPRNTRNVKRAILTAYRDLPYTNRRWTYYDKRITIDTEAAQTEGTISYDSATRIVEITDSTFPEDSRFYRIRIDRAHYDIERYIDATHVELSVNANPITDYPAGTSYFLYRDAYPLPVSFTAIGQMFDVNRKNELVYVNSDYNHARDIFFDTPSTPKRFTIRNAGEYYNSLAVVFGPPPLTADPFDFIFQRAPRQLYTEKKTNGNATILGGTQTVAVDQPVFDPSRDIGAIFRFSSDSTEPSGLVGGWAGDDPSTFNDNPYFAERVIASVTGPTQAELDAAVSESDLTNVGYTISDPIDVESGAMLTFFHRLCEYEFSKLTKREDKNDRKRDALEAQEAAFAHDARTRAFYDDGYGQSGGVPFHMRAWSAVPDEIVIPN